MNLQDQSRARLIDGAGRVHDYALYRAQKSPGHRLSDERFIEYAVKNLGHIVVRCTDGRMRLQARRGVVSGMSVAQLMYLLANEQPRTTILMTLDTSDMQWAHHVLGGWDQALVRINALLGPAAVSREIEVVAEPIATLPPTSPLRWAMELWRGHATTFNANVIEAHAQDPSVRFTLYERAERSDAFQLIKTSRGFPSEVQRCLDRLVGFDVRDRPDFDYGQMCHAAYTRAVGRDEPILETVQGAMRWRRLEVSAHHYRRLMLPLHDQSGRSWVLSATMAEHVPIVLPEARVEHG